MICISTWEAPCATTSLVASKKIQITNEHAETGVKYMQVVFLHFRWCTF